jgi:hypothetical protein
MASRPRHYPHRFSSGYQIHFNFSSITDKTFSCLDVRSSLFIAVVLVTSDRSSMQTCNFPSRPSLRRLMPQQQCNMCQIPSFPAYAFVRFLQRLPVRIIDDQLQGRLTFPWRFAHPLPVMPCDKSSVLFTAKFFSV